MKKNKLNFETLRLHDIVTGKGDFTRTPEASELDELEVRYHLADWLYLASTEGSISDKQYIRYGSYLDTIPLVGDYFRYLCAYR
jgi:hypothetical protein